MAPSLPASLTARRTGNGVNFIQESLLRRGVDPDVVDLVVQGFARQVLKLPVRGIERFGEVDVSEPISEEALSDLDVDCKERVGEGDDFFQELFEVSTKLLLICIERKIHDHRKKEARQILGHIQRFFLR